LTLSTGERFSAASVVLATGIRYYSHMPSDLEGMPEQFVTHCSQHSSLEKFAGRTIAVLGGGSSALDFAALAAEAGADVEVFVRNDNYVIYDAPQAKRPLLKRLRAPWTGLGPGWKSWIAVNLPLLIHRFMSEQKRLEFVRKHLGPAGDWIIKKTIEERVPLHTGMSLVEKRVAGGKLNLTFKSEKGTREIAVDHLVAGTGYRSGLDRLSFIDSTLRAEIRRHSDGSPALNSRFEASVPGLYFVGLAAAASFGPLQRFVYGVEFACRRVAPHLKAALAASGLPFAGAAGGAANENWILVGTGSGSKNP
jgi:thioredoxin reductase